MTFDVVSLSPFPQFSNTIKVCCSCGDSNTCYLETEDIIKMSIIKHGYDDVIIEDTSFIDDVCYDLTFGLSKGAKLKEEVEDVLFNYIHSEYFKGYGMGDILAYLVDKSNI
jgi:hypothetical protein